MTAHAARNRTALAEWSEVVATHVVDKYRTNMAPYMEASACGVWQGAGGMGA